MKKIGRIIISEELLLRFLDFYPEGKIISVGYGYNGVIEFVIEHPEMPVVQNGAEIPLITPTYITYQDSFGHKVSLRQQL